MESRLKLEPVSHNQNMLCSDLAKLLPLDVDPYTYDSPHTKTCLLLQAHFSRLTLPCSDYYTDTKSVLDQAVRILQVTLCMSNTVIVEVFGGAMVAQSSGQAPFTSEIVSSNLGSDSLFFM